MSQDRRTRSNAADPVKGKLGDQVEYLCEEIRALYLEDDVPWVVGYSGGKDSTAILQLVWMAVRELPRPKRKKKIHVISTDTLVENPVVASWVSNSLVALQEAAHADKLPFLAHRLTPALEDSFWVNLIGKGYPAPRYKFRWCTERLKIKPSNRFILNVVRESGEVILVLGTRKAESSIRASRMNELAVDRARARLSPNASLPNSLVYTPIEDWSNDDVWVFLMQHGNPWGHNNKDLLSMYRGATEGGECPLVVDTSTPSCGDSRFGCWVCTLVDKDKSMEAMIQNDEEKEWMGPLLDLRNKLDMDPQEERKIRDFRRLAGRVQLYEYVNKETGEKQEGFIPGPYTQEARAEWLKELLEAQTWIRGNGPDYVRDLELISLGELQEIRRIWVNDKHEVEDLLPNIYEQATGGSYPGEAVRSHHFFGHDEMALLREVCEGDDLHFQLVRDLLDVEASFRTQARRAGLFRALEDAFQRSAFDGVEDAVARARVRTHASAAAKRGDRRALMKVLAGKEGKDEQHPGHGG